MNRVELVGRLTKEPDIRVSQSGTTVCRFTVAVNRIKKVEGQPEADFINCISFGKTAEYMEKYIKKGYLVSVEGRIQTGSYENQQGQKVYTTDIACDSVQNLTPKQDTPKADSYKEPKPKEEYAGSLDISADDLPF